MDKEIIQDTVKPIYLFADSRPLFLKIDEKPFLASVRHFIEAENPRAAYIGASNGDDPVYYSIFEAAMENIGIRDCKMILSSFSEDSQKFLSEADIILLAGGSASRGWEVMERTGLKEVIFDRYNGGAILMGVSAGAVHLGLFGWEEEDFDVQTFFYTFGLVPFIISAHDEARAWEKLKKAVGFMGEHVPGLGIPSGGGLIYHPNHTIEPIQYPLEEFSISDGKLCHNLLMPGQSIPT